MKQLLLIAIIFLLSFSTVHALTLNSYKTNLYSISSTYPFYNPKLFDNTVNNTWVVALSTTAPGVCNYRIAQYNRALELLSDTGLGGGMNSPCYTDSSFSSDITSEYIKFIETDGAGKGKLNTFNLMTNVKTELDSCLSMSQYPQTNRYAVDGTNNIFVWQKHNYVGIGSYDYTKTNYMSSTCDGSGYLSSIPIIYFGVNSNVKLLACGGREHLLALQTSGQVFDIILDQVSLEYKIAIPLALDGTTDADNFNAYCDTNSTIYFIYKDATSPTLMRINRYYYYLNGDSDVLSYLDSSQHNMTQYELNINATNYFYSPSIWKNEQGIFGIGYAYKNSTNYYYNFIGQYGSCACSEWINDQCVNDVMRQTRVCNPSTCAQTINFTASLTCALQYNQSLGIYPQKLQSYSNTTECLSSYVNVGSESSCSMIMNINPSCNSNINVSVVSTIEPTVFDNRQCSSQINSYASSCNPSYDCHRNNMTCYNVMETNNSFTYTKQYSAGQLLTTKATGFVSQDCYCKFLWLNNGIKNFRVHGYTTVNCDIACRNENVCLDQSYLGIKQIDCSISNVTLCSNGCDTKLNACNPSSTDKTLFDIENIINSLTVVQKFGIWILVTILSAVGAFLLFGGTKHNIEFILLISGLVFLGGIAIGFVPIWIVVLIIIISVVMLIFR